jgi:alanine racemase
MPPRPRARPTAAFIDLGAISFNMRSARSFIGEEFAYKSYFKENASGHGAVQCSRNNKNESFDSFGISTFQEAL